jgi:alcohol dehydrogenase, propanol-preferring
MRLPGPGRPLEPVVLPVPEPGPGQIRVRVRSCGVCRTDVHLRDGELAAASYPRVPGHQIVGVVDAQGPGVASPALGARVGVPWLGWACGVCADCRAGRENLCARAQFTGCHRDGGFAEHAIADAAFALALPDGPSDAELAPLLCAGLIGYRALRMAGDGAAIGLYGFGAAAHIAAQVLRGQGRRCFAFTRAGDRDAQAFARELGAAWAGASEALPPEPLDAALIFAPVGGLVPLALRAVRPGGTVVCAGIHMSDIPAFPYALLWGERCVRSVANLTRRDGAEFFSLVSRLDLRVHAAPYALGDAERALADLREGRLRGAAVLEVSSGAEDR